MKRSFSMTTNGSGWGVENLKMVDRGSRYLGPTTGPIHSHEALIISTFADSPPNPQLLLKLICAVITSPLDSIHPW